MQAFRRRLEGIGWADMRTIVDSSAHVGHIHCLASSRLQKIIQLTGADSTYRDPMSLSTKSIADAALTSVVRLHEISPLQLCSPLEDTVVSSTEEAPTHLEDTDHAVRIDHMQKQVQKFQRDMDWKHADNQSQTVELTTEMRKCNTETVQKMRDLNRKVTELQSALDRATETNHAEEITVLQQQVTELQSALDRATETNHAEEITVLQQQVTELKSTMHAIELNPDVSRTKASVPVTQPSTNIGTTAAGPSTTQVLQLLSDVIQQTVVDKTKTDAKVASVLSAIELTDKVNNNTSTTQILQLLAEVIQQTVVDKAKTDAKITSVLSEIKRRDEVHNNQVVLVSSKSETLASDVSKLTRELAIVRLDALELKQQAALDHKGGTDTVCKPVHKKASAVSKPVHKKASACG